MFYTRSHAAPRTRRGRRITMAAVGTGFAFTLGVTSLVTLFARRVVTPPRKRRTDVRVVALNETTGTVTLSTTPETLLDGGYGLFFDRDTGYAKIGPIVRIIPEGVVRELVSVDLGTLRLGMKCRLTGWYFLHPEELGFPWSEVDIETDLGPAPAWRIDSEKSSDRWVIQVHGRGVDRTECIRAVPAFREKGYTSLLISYRNDGTAPQSSDGLYALGDVEWRDVEPAIEYAIAHGARHVILMGWSMGGATVLQSVSRSAHSAIVRGVVLESPVVDWVTALEHQAGLLRVPRIVVMGVYRMLSQPWGRVFTGQHTPIDLRRLDFVARAVEIRVPILILHSSGDQFVPNSASRALAKARPDIVTFPRIDRAGHARVWNYDPDAFSSAIKSWLEAIKQ